MQVKNTVKRNVIILNKSFNTKMTKYVIFQKVLLEKSTRHQK